jgi:aldose 1-epimerase
MKTHFGKTKDGRDVTLYTIENDNVMIKACDYGAILVSFIDKKTGIDVSEGFDCVEDYIANQGAHIGASIGRTANRIEKGILHIDDKVYQLPITNSGNTLHGGVNGFDTKLWSVLEEKDQLTFRYTSPDGEEGYPGNLFVKVVYRLLDHGVAIISEGRADADTVFAFTNHSYFNCDESSDAMHHIVTIPADMYAPTDNHGLTLDEMLPVEGTPFDFRTPKEAGRDINEDHPQLKAGNGYDHYFDIKGEGMRHMATIQGKKLALSMASDFPGFHMYTSNFSQGQKGKHGVIYNPRSAICLEAEYLPNGINYADVKEKPIVRAGETLRHEIQFTLKRI